MCPTDVDDCADAPCCQQVCANTPGGYECGCYAGYRLSADGCGCEGERLSMGGSWGSGRTRREPRLPVATWPQPAFALLLGAD